MAARIGPHKTSFCGDMKMNMDEDDSFPMAFILGMMVFLMAESEHSSMCCASQEACFWEASSIFRIWSAHKVRSGTMTTTTPATSDPSILRTWLLPPPVRWTSRSFPPHRPCMSSVIAASWVGRRDGVSHTRAERFVNTTPIDARLETLPTVSLSSSPSSSSSSSFATAASSKRQVDGLGRSAGTAASFWFERAA